jgi:pyruvate oxidase
MNVADVLVEKLVGLGVRRFYGVPGDAVNAVVDSIRRHRDQAEFVLVRHEENAALIAASEAKLTGRLAVCLATSGPGAIHLLNGLYEAKMESCPVLAVTGQLESDLLGLDGFQEVNLVRLYEDVARYNQPVVNPEQAPRVISRAIRACLVDRTVSHLNIPQDVARMTVPSTAADSPLDYAQGVTVPPAADLEKAREVLREEGPVVILVGKGARGAEAEIHSFAEMLQAPIVKTLPAKDLFPDEDPLCVGGLGMLGTRPAQEAMDRARILVMVGTSYPYTWFLPSRARTVQIDTRATQIGKRYAVDVPLVGDARLTLQALLPGIPSRTDQSFLDRLQKSMKTWREKMASIENDPRVPIRPPYVAATLSRRAPPGAILSVDVGNVTVWMARNFSVQAGQRMIFSGWLATMGVGLPGAIAAKFSHPERPVIAVCGDGGFAMTMSDLITAVRHALDLTVVVLNNGKLGMIKFEMEVEGFPDWGTDLVNPDFAAYARACGAWGRSVERPEDLEPALSEALAQKGVALLDVHVDPQERPVPPVVTLQQASGFVRSLLKEKFDL